MNIETYEQAVERTGRRWPYRTVEWPCPACGKAECDLDVEGERFGYMRWVYTHIPQTEASETK
jgi:hypothetical protein